MNKELDDIAKSRLYGLTSIVCSIWLLQSGYKTMVSEQNLLTISNIVFYLSILIVIAYTAYSSLEIRKSKHQGKTNSGQ